MKLHKHFNTQGISHSILPFNSVKNNTFAAQNTLFKR